MHHQEYYINQVILAWDRFNKDPVAGIAYVDKAIRELKTFRENNKNKELPSLFDKHKHK